MRDCFCFRRDLVRQLFVNLSTRNTCIPIKLRNKNLKDFSFICWQFFMVSHVGNCLRNTRVLLGPSFSCALHRVYCSHALSSSCVSSPQLQSPITRAGFDHQQQCLDSTTQGDINVLATKVRVGSNADEIVQSLTRDQECNNIQPSHILVSKLLCRFEDDWKSALGVFKWAGSRPGYKHTPEACDVMVDILGKMKQMDEMRVLLDEMHRDHLVTIKTVGKAMRRFSGAGRWEDAVRIFDELGRFGLEKNTESMNLLLDTLCKEGKVEQARGIFLVLKSHISPNANTFNIFIHGWCKANRVDEAYWTMQEMKGNGCHPCAISYSTIVQFYCSQFNFSKVYELLDEMQAQGCPPNVVTYTTVMRSLTKSGEFEEALQVVERMKSLGCKPDSLFYNAWIHTLGRTGRLDEALHLFEVDMPNTGVPPNTSTYNSMIAMFCHHGQELKALNLLKEMETSVFCKPDGRTYHPLFKACFRTGQIDSLLNQLLDDMAKKHNLSLDLSAYALLIHGLCRANRCEWAYCLFEEMIGQDITPRYQTCHFLLEEVKLKNMYDATEKIEVFMKKFKCKKQACQGI